MATPHDDERLDQALETIDENKRSALRKMLVGAFAAPVVTTFAVSAVMVSSTTMVGATDSSGGGNYGDGEEGYDG